MIPSSMSRRDHAAFKDAWEHYPTQDNEGYQPERGSFKAGFMEGVRYERDRTTEVINAFKRDWLRGWREQLVELLRK